MNPQIAVLNKINAVGMMAVRASQDANPLLVAVLEHQIAEWRRDAEAAEISSQVEFWTRANAVAIAGIRGTSDVLSTFRVQ